MIYTCTLNPSVDYVVELTDFHFGELNRATKTAFFPGGKGINVSRVLKRLGVDNTAFGFIGGFTGNFITDALKKEQIHCDFVEVDGDTRINIKLKASIETEINGQGPLVSDKDQQQLIDRIERLQEGDFLVLAGSLPPSLPAHFYITMMETAKKKGVHVVVDTSGDALKQAIANKPFLVKPNQFELGELFETTIRSHEEIITYGKKLIEDGVEHVIVSLAGDGAFFFHKDMTLFATVPKGVVKNSVGAGDSMVAGFLAAYVNGKSLEEAFRYSVAAGSATAFSEDLCTKVKVEQLLNEITITRMGDFA
ncbi:fructose-1-phosphate kinase [Thermolongibacillus altinsuensis]|uniref:Tagatose-6-phosphate kinase n=1 Tax=Thermolongibacillus altinsuensis TaxID=575256 RepID=A0A4R1QGA2_9BACL|nr:1-phosphofructokinase [Thermolongibacillus altinsuensis]TCL48061.1 fructose-1-phosphate kinase [Thermolongibacillus altinsuensis]GMB09677.1 1-phosphofructokinase [Thermolongibacillus altinsuensis]